MKIIVSVFFALALAASVWGADRGLLTPEPRRISDEAIAADIKVMKELQGRLAALNGKGVPIVSYHFAKAQAWLDFALDEYTINDRSRVVEEALHQALSLIEEMEADKKNIGMTTPIIPTSAVVRPDLWEKAETLKKRVSPRCAGDKVAQLEVQLVWAGHEEKEFDWRHAKPYLQAAERLAKEADEQMAVCPEQEGVTGKPEQLSPGGISLAAEASITGLKPEQPVIHPAVAALPVTPVVANAGEPAAATFAASLAAFSAPDPQAVATASEKRTAGALPFVPAVAAAHTACPELATCGTKMLSSLPDRVHFALDRADIGPASAALLDWIAMAMKSAPIMRVMLQGHADQRGQSDYNIRLSQRRANSVRSYLVNAGVAGDRISVIALGKTKPLIPEETIDGYARNRRVQFVFTSCEAPLLVNQREDLQPEQIR